MEKFIKNILKKKGVEMKVYSFNYEMIMQPETIIALNKDEFLSMLKWLRTNNIKWYGGKSFTHNNILVCFNQIDTIYMNFYLGEEKKLEQIKATNKLLFYYQILLKEDRTDSIVEAVRADLLRRSQLGIKKYGTTLADNPLDLKQWLQHAYEETLDNANYLKRAIMELEK
jgi:hypothetical protein